MVFITLVLYFLIFPDIAFGLKYLGRNANANTVDPDQTAPQEQSDQDLHCLQFCKTPPYRTNGLGQI